MRQKTFVNDGFAVFAVGIKTQCKCDVHVNEWMSPSTINFIDFGVRIYDAGQVKKLGIYVPFEIDITEIIDLSESLCNEKVARGIFNTICSIKQSGDNPIIEIEYNGRKENLIKFCQDDLTIRKLSSGTIIYFNIASLHTLLTQTELYIRFRLPHKSISNLFLTVPWSIKSLFESPVEKYQYNYVMKINEVRSLPFEVRCIPELANQKIDKIIVTLTTNEQYDVNDSDCYKVRQLEEDLYSTYVPNDFLCSNAVVYQWLIENKVHYNFNFTITKCRLSP